MKETEYGLEYSIKEFLSSRKDFFRFFYESDAIEGIDHGHTRIITEEELKRIESGERIGHDVALEYVLDNLERTPTNEDIFSMQALLREDLYKEIIVGKFRRPKPMYVVSEEDDKIFYTGVPHSRHVPKLMRELEKDVRNLENPSEQDIWDLHYRFENIHPLEDGNGRVGRLYLNWLSISHLGKVFLLTYNKRHEYYKRIEDYKEVFKVNNPKVKFYKDFQKDAKLVRVRHLAELYDRIRKE